MIVLVPYGITAIGVLDETAPPPIEAVRLNLDVQGIDATYLPCVDDHTYAGAVRDLWAAGAPFAIVEHDVIPWPGWLDDLDDCPLPWCGFGYIGPGGRWLVEMGCTRIDPAGTSLDGTPLADERATWQHVDVSVREAFRRVGHAEPHEHRPGVAHLHRGYG